MPFPPTVADDEAGAEAERELEEEEEEDMVLSEAARYFLMSSATLVWTKSVRPNRAFASCAPSREKTKRCRRCSNSASSRNCAGVGVGEPEDATAAVPGRAGNGIVAFLPEVLVAVAVPGFVAAAR